LGILPDVISSLKHIVSPVIGKRKENTMLHNIFYRLVGLLAILVIMFPGDGLALTASSPRELQNLNLPDLNSAYIARLPRYDYDAPKNQPSAGDTVTFEAQIANRGGQATGSFTYTWSMDGAVVSTATSPSLAPGQATTLTLEWSWQTGPHMVRIELDPENLIGEVSEENNVVEDQTNALAVGFWVEQSVYDWFNAHQVELGIGSVSWDDWAQRQLRTWNQVFADAVHPLTPQGVLERVRLDKVTILPDGAWPDCSNTPIPEDKTVDLVWGFGSEGVGVASGHTCGEFNFYINHPELQNIEPPLLHEMSHARYLVDLYGLGQFVHNVLLTSSVDAAATSLVVNQNVEADWLFSLPSYLAVDGELIICQAKSGTTFLDCSRGAEGTNARPHDVDTPVHLAAVRVQDGQGNLVQGSPALPVIGDWHDHLSFGRYPNDMMSSVALNYGQHSAFAWNRILGRRPVCGNYNGPCNIGEYLNDIPQHNILEIRDPSGRPLSGMRVDVYRAKPFPIYYGRVFFKDPDATFYTDAEGRADLGSQPFEPGSPIIHTFGYSNAVLLLKISSNQQAAYRFFEVTEANEAYWFGNQDSAVYVITVDAQASTLEVTIDIMPHKSSNTIKSKGKGNIPVAILSTSDFDARALIDKTSLTFGRTGEEASLASCKRNRKDVNRDGLPDLICIFKTNLTGFQIGDTEGILKGRTVEGVLFEGHDSVRILK